MYWLPLTLRLHNAGGKITLRIILLLMFLFSSVSATVTVVPTATLIGTLISISPKFIGSSVFQDIDKNSQYDAGNSIMTDIIFFS